MRSQNTITLYGNVGADPEVHDFAGEEVTRQVYDPIIDDVVEIPFTTKDRELRTFSIAINKTAEDGEEITRWIRCSDWRNVSTLVRKGDRVRVVGSFRTRTVEKDGETKTYRNFDVQELTIERHKIRQQAA